MTSTTPNTPAEPTTPAAQAEPTTADVAPVAAETSAPAATEPAAPVADDSAQETAEVTAPAEAATPAETAEVTPSAESTESTEAPEPAASEAAAPAEATKPAEPAAETSTPAEEPASAPASDAPEVATPAAPTPAAPEAAAPAAPAVPEPVPAPEPEAAAPAAPAPKAPAPVKSDADKALEAFGRIDDDGNVFVKDGEEDRQIGGYPDGAPEDPLALYVRRFRDLEATVNLFEARLPSLNSNDIDSTLKTLREAVKLPNAIGDLPALRQRVEDLAKRGNERKEEAKKEREAAKQRALETRRDVVERAEAIAAQDPARTQWKQSGQTLRDLLDEWKGLQRKGPRLDKSTEDELWKRFSGARAVFDRHRRQFFSELDAKQSEAKAIKEQLIAEAEKLQGSTEWGATSAEYRKLMDRWKAAPRASRKEDDALWARFRAAQQVFFDARRAADEVVGAEQKENLVKKQALAVEAEKLLPVTDVDRAREKLRDIQDQWDEIGRVPNSDFPKLEGRMRAVEDAIRAKVDEEWKRSNPETKARAEGMLGQLEGQIDDLKAQVAEAEKAGDPKALKELQDALATKESWLEQIRGSIS